ncbi:class I SAM-dependent methyltransferase [Nocardia terpenica]|uniref:class I SAM-dependent methyltransferase n=1 Tax=Nocardia terpenica TaxID=455432 RepID=UPI001894E59C|nr:class I SAM-dependent methyltransferase [Nocardia terpenica]MBF6063431.1 class I SAM-dependent methyltransferase [Nocardia terpenica]MBF6105987.1 class I SAM-dependent methyltransferase [Nocardia terpenica]MBF6113428.1 class I SAM-dependent methyltransferase [Nocardia terpenica]MBF6119728.1 class I SAM-dependent methyltransferase [Nocardia terpenica]MBF6152139.1 class I SAM-dependent methyltransferase [Nocardia terpenica]
MAHAAYDEIAEWYERTFLAGRRVQRDGGDPLGIVRALEEWLGGGVGPCLDIGCGTGVFAARIRELGWEPVGVDLSGGMLRYAVNRLPVVRADAGVLPIRDASVAAAVAIMVHTDMPDYMSVVAEVARVLRPGGRFVHIGVHPCFCGGFADRSNAEAIVIRPGYAETHWTKASWTDRGLRDKVRATHLPLPRLLRIFVDNGLVLDDFVEGGVPIPTMLAVQAHRSCSITFATDDMSVSLME